MINFQEFDNFIYSFDKNKIYSKIEKKIINHYDLDFYLLKHYKLSLKFLYFFIENIFSKTQIITTDYNIILLCLYCIGRIEYEDTIILNKLSDDIKILKLDKFIPLIIKTIRHLIVLFNIKFKLPVTKLDQMLNDIHNFHSFVMDIIQFDYTLYDFIKFHPLSK